MLEQQVVMSATRSEDAWSGFSFSMSLDANGALDAVDGSPLELPAVDSGSDGQVSGEKGSDDMARMDREDSWPQTVVELVLGDTLGDPERLDATMALLHIVADSAGSCDKTSPEDPEPSDADLTLDGALLMRVRSVLRAMDRERGRQEELIPILERLAGVGRLRGTMVMLKGVITDTKVARQRSSLGLASAESDDGPESVGPPVAKLQRKATISALRALLPDDMEWGTVDDHLSRIFTSILEPAHEDAPSVEQHIPQGTTTEPVLDPATHFTYHSEGLSSIPYDHLVSAPVTHFPYVEQQQPLPPLPSGMAPLPAPMLYDHHIHAQPQPVDMSVPCQSGEAGGVGMPTMHQQQQQQLRPQPFGHLTTPTAHPITLEHAHEIPPSAPCYPSPMPPYVPLVSPSAGGPPAPTYGPPSMMMPPPPHTMSPHAPVEHPYPPQYVAYPSPSPYMVPMSPGMPVSPPFHMGAMGPVPSPQQHMMENIPVNGQHQGYWHPGVTHPFDDKPKKGGNKRGDYKCGKCGELKRNHTCKKVVKEMKEMATQVDDCLTLATRAETPVLPGSWPAAFIPVTPASPAPVEQSTTAAKPGRARAMSAGIVASV